MFPLSLISGHQEKHRSLMREAMVESGATRAGIGTTWTSNELKVGHTYYWYIRTINALARLLL
jgi:hypothetical protein